MKKSYKLLIFIFAIIVSVTIFLFRNYFNILSGYGLLGLFLLSIIGNATVFLPAPVILTAFVAGAVFNPLLVALTVSFGASIGEITGYLVGYGGEEIIKKDIRLLKAKALVEKYGLWAVFVLAVIPNPFFDLAGIVSGATGTPVIKYFSVVWLGKFIKFAAFAYFGAGAFGVLSRL